MLHDFIGNVAPSLYGINLAASSSSCVIAEAHLITMVLSCLVLRHYVQPDSVPVLQTKDHGLFTNRTKAA